MLNPDRNLYSVAPVGGIVIIGRAVSLRTGLTRDNALNLIGWLCIASNAKPEEIAAVLKEAETPLTKPVVAAVEAPKVSVPPMVEKGVLVPPVPPSRQPGGLAVNGRVGPEVEKTVEPFIGAVDAEEKAALDAVIAKVAATPVAAVDSEALARAWGVKNA